MTVPPLAFGDDHFLFGGPLGEAGPWGAAATVACPRHQQPQPRCGPPIVPGSSRPHRRHLDRRRRSSLHRRPARRSRLEVVRMLRRRRPAMRVVLASPPPPGSRAAGCRFEPEVIVSGVDEDRFTSTDAANLAAALPSSSAVRSPRRSSLTPGHRLRLGPRVRGRDLRQAGWSRRGGRPLAPHARQQRRAPHRALRTPRGRGVPRDGVDDRALRRHH